MRCTDRNQYRGSNGCHIERHRPRITAAKHATRDGDNDPESDSTDKSQRHALKAEPIAAGMECQREASECEHNRCDRLPSEFLPATNREYHSGDEWEQVEYKNR